MPNEKLPTWDRAFSEELVRQIKAITASKRPIADMNADLARLFPDRDLAAPAEKTTTCGRCDCGGFRTCTVWIFVNGHWSPQFVYLEPCGFLPTIFGCLRQMLGW